MFVFRDVFSFFFLIFFDVRACWSLTFQNSSFFSFSLVGDSQVEHFFSTDDNKIAQKRSSSLLVTSFSSLFPPSSRVHSYSGSSIGHHLSFTPSIMSKSESPTLCSIEQCSTLYDVHCFHCRMNMCSHHYFEHKQQQQLTSDHDQAMEDLLQRASSKCFCISSNGHSLMKSRRTLTNPFVSSSYLLKKMRQQAMRRPQNIKPIITTKTTAIKLYNLRKRPGKRQRKLLATKTTTVTTTTVKFCRTVLKTRLKTTKLCNRKLPCPYHTVQS